MSNAGIGGYVKLGLTLYFFPTDMYGYLDQLPLKSPNYNCLEKIIVRIRPHLDMFIGVLGVPNKCKNKILDKTDF